MRNTVNRRRHERFALLPMYTPVSVRLLGEEKGSLEGHAYDLSEGGAQFELDAPIKTGTPIAMQVTLPRGNWAEGAETEADRNILVTGNVVWLDDSEPGPVRMAVAFTSFARVGDKERLHRQIVSGRLSRAA